LLVVERMGFLLKVLRKNPELHSIARRIYGKTLGFYWAKEIYAKKRGFYNGEKRVCLLNESHADDLISEKLRSDNPFAVARYGSNEFRNLFQENEFGTLCFNAGFSPNDKSLLKDFRKEYFESSMQIDILAIWNYRNQFNRKRRWLRNFPNIEYLVPLSAASGIGSSWIKCLEGKRVLVIHPCKKTIENQMKKRKELGILPKLKSLEVIRAVETIAGEKDDRFRNWFEALNFMKEDIEKKRF
jgi:hypothetical protein